MKKWSRVVLTVLVASTPGCMEMLVNQLQRSARFELACIAPNQHAVVKDDASALYRAYDGPVLERQALSVVVVPPVDDLCSPLSPHYAYWTPRLVAVDGRRKLLGPDRKTGNERIVGFPDRCVSSVSSACAWP
jgi:hypothetical protein